MQPLHGNGGAHYVVNCFVTADSGQGAPPATTKIRPLKTIYFTFLPLAEKYRDVKNRRISHAKDESRKNFPPQMKIKLHGDIRLKLVCNVI